MEQRKESPITKFQGKWMKLENIILNEVNQKKISHVFFPLQMLTLDLQLCIFHFGIPIVFWKLVRKDQWYISIYRRQNAVVQLTSKIDQKGLDWHLGLEIRAEKEIQGGVIVSNSFWEVYLETCILLQKLGPGTSEHHIWVLLQPEPRLIDLHAHVPKNSHKIAGFQVAT